MNQNIQKKYHISQRARRDFRRSFEGALSALQKPQRVFQKKPIRQKTCLQPRIFEAQAEIQSRLYFFFMPEFTGSELSF